MADDIGSTVPRRELGRYLREMRERERISHDSAATALDCSRQKIWRIEKGSVPVRASDVRVLCDLYGADAKISQALAALAIETRTKGWWHAYGDAVPAWFSLYVGLEMAANRLRHYNGELVPGIVQTKRYAEAIFRNRPGMTDRDRERAVTVRLHRQGVLTRSLPAPPELDVILSEAVLRRPIADREGMRQQLRHLVSVTTQSNVSVRILPLAAGPTLASETGAFVLLDFPVAVVGALSNRPPSTASP